MLVLQMCVVFFQDLVFEFSVFCVMRGFFVLKNEKIYT